MTICLYCITTILKCVKALERKISYFRNEICVELIYNLYLGAFCSGGGGWGGSCTGLNSI